MNWSLILAGLAVLALFLLATKKSPGLSLIIYLPLSAAFVLSGISFIENNLHALAGFYISLAVITIITGPLCLWLWGGDPEKDRWKRKIGKTIFITLMVILAVAIALPAFYGMVGIYFLFLLAFLIASVCTFVKTTRTANYGFIITTLGTSLRQNLPLPAALRSAAASQPAARAGICEKTADWLSKGFPLSVAIANSYPKFPSKFLSQIKQAEKINQLPRALESMEKDIVKQACESSKAGAVKPVVYVGMVLAVAVLITLAITIFVMPKLVEVFQDYADYRLPLPTRKLMAVSNSLRYGYTGPVIGLCIVGLVFGRLIISWAALLSRRKPGKTSLVFRLKDRLRWHTPLLGWYERNYCCLMLTELLKNSVNAGIPAERALADSAELDVNHCFKNRLLKASQQITGGESLPEVMIRYKLPKTIAWAYRHCSSQKTLISVLQMLEDFYRTNYSYMVNLARFILTPLSIVAIGLVVGFICYAVFLPMVELIEMLADMVP